ncbi:GNAT family N-acetyltransferase [Paenibacillus sp. FA6]|uniref:GNAT family N-acetyltransferase n=1 Tax=Paenibacillus sp. FA6 TaxID=3413029 RepID=UPI003F65B6A7
MKFEYRAIETDRLHLRILTLGDTEKVFRHFSDDNVTKFMDIEPCKNIKEAEEIIKYHLEDSGCRWGLFSKEDNELVGTCGFHFIREVDLTAEVGFDLSRPYWGKGLMSEVMAAVIEYGFTVVKLEVIDATVEPENERSNVLMNRLGFKRESELREKLIYYYLNRKNWEESLINTLKKRKI